MPTTIDELKVKVKGDIKDYKAKMAKTRALARTTSAKVKASFLKMGAGIKSVTGLLGQANVMIAGVAGAGGLGLLTKASLDQADAIAKLSANTGVHTDLIQELRVAASQTGVSQRELDNSLLQLSRRMADAQDGNLEYKEGFDSLGVALTDSSGKMRNMEDIIKDIADGTKELSTEQEKANALYKIFGRAGTKLVNTFKGGSAELERYQKVAQEMGLVIEEDLLKQSEKANDAMDILARTVKTKVVKAIVELAPTIVKASEKLTELIIKADKFRQTGLVDETQRQQITGLKTDLKETRKEITETEQEIQKLQKSQGRFKEGSLIFSQYQKQIDAANKELSQQQIELIAIEAELNGITKAQDENKRSAKESGQATDEATKSNVVSLAEKRKQLMANAAALKKNQDIEKESAKIVAATQKGDKSDQINAEIKLLEQAKEKKLGIESELVEAIKMKRGELQEFESDERQKEIERLQERNVLLDEIDREKHANEIAANDERIQSLMALEDQNSNFVIQQEIKKRRARQALLQASVGDMSTIFGNIMTLSRGHSKELFELSKRAAQATAVTQGILAVQRALANPPGPPFSYIQAAAAATTAAVNVAQIEATKFNRGITSVPGSSSSGDSVPALVQPKERIVAVNPNKDLTDFLERERRFPRTNQPSVTNIFNIGDILGDEESGRMLVEKINVALEKAGVRFVS
jgi:hypothetical protein